MRASDADAPSPAAPGPNWLWDTGTHQITRMEDHFLTRKIWAAMMATAAAVLLPANRSAIFNSVAPIFSSTQSATVMPTQNPKLSARRCHDGHATHRLAIVRWTAIRVAHTKSPTVPKGEYARSRVSSDGFDVSSACLSCDA